MTINLFNRDKLDEYIAAEEMRFVFSSPVEFSELIESMANKFGLGIFDTLVYFTESVGCEYDTVAKLLTDNIKEKIAMDVKTSGEYSLKTDKSEAPAVTF